MGLRDAMVGGRSSSFARAPGDLAARLTAWLRRPAAPILRWDPAMACLFTVATVLGRLTAPVDGGPAMIWPAAGVSLVWLARHADRRWRTGAPAVVVLAGITLAVNLATGADLRKAVAFTVANVVMALVGAAWLARCPERQGVWLDAPAKLFHLFLSALAGAVASGVAGTAAMAVLSSAGWQMLVEWILRNLAGSVLVGLLWFRLARRPDHVLPGPRPVLVLALGLTTLTTGAVVFALRDPALTFLTIPICMFAALRTDTRTTGWLTAAVATAVVLGAVFDLGPLAGRPGAERGMIAQAFVVVLLMVAMTIVLDRVERARLESRLEANRLVTEAQAQLMERILVSLSEGVVLIERGGGVALSNKAADRLLGFGARQDGVPQELPEAFLDPAGGTNGALAEVFHGGEAVAGGDVDLVLPGGDRRTLHIEASPMAAAEEGLAVAVLRDVTEERRRTEEMSAFAGVVAHDLRNPLTALRGWLDLLEEATDDPGVQGLVARAMGSAQRMNRLIEDLLSYSVTRGGEIRPEAVHLEGLVADVVQGMERGATGPRITFEADAWAQVDRAAFTQVVANLVGNAVKYTAPGVAAQVHVSAEACDGGSVRLCVADRGIGVPPGSEAAIFEEFHRVPSAAGSYVGTGLGLAICRRVVQRHGGTITARNREGGGLAVDVVVPGATPTEVELAAASAAAQARAVLRAVVAGTAPGAGGAAGAAGTAGATPGSVPGPPANADPERVDSGI